MIILRFLELLCLFEHYFVIILCVIILCAALLNLFFAKLNMPRFVFVEKNLVISDSTIYISGIYTCKEGSTNRKRYNVKITGTTFFFLLSEPIEDGITVEVTFLTGVSSC